MHYCRNVLFFMIWSLQSVFLVKMSIQYFSLNTDESVFLEALLLSALKDSHRDDPLKDLWVGLGRRPA